MKEFLRDWIPPGFIKLARSLRPGGYALKGPYASWAEACRQSDGYDSQAILDGVDRATARLLAGNQGGTPGAPFAFPLAACLLRTAVRKGRAIHVIDFGGGLGSVWHRSGAFLAEGIASWSVVEQPHFAARGREKYQTPPLRFFETMTEAAAANPPDAIIFSGVLQYLERPFDILREAAALRPVSIVVDRTPYAETQADVILVQQVPAEIYQASYPLYIFRAGSIEDGLRPDYRRVLSFDSSDGVWPYRGGTAHFRGEYYERME